MLVTEVLKPSLRFLGIRQWRLDSDSGTPGFNKKDEIDSFQNVPGIKVC